MDGLKGNLDPDGAIKAGIFFAIMIPLWLIVQNRFPQSAPFLWLFLAGLNILSMVTYISDTPTKRKSTNKKTQTTE